MRTVKAFIVAALGVAVLGWSGTVTAQELVVSMWGGNWKAGAKKIIASEFTKRTGMSVRFITGGTMDRLTKAKVNKGDPESDLTITTTHVAFLYISDGLFEKLDMSLIPNAKELFPAAIRSPYHIGLYSYVYTPVFRTDAMPAGFRIRSWNDLWGPAVKGKLALPDFDPSHIIVVAALLSGADAAHWKAGIPKLKALKPSIKAFYQSDAVSQELMTSGEAPVQVMLSINGYHLIEQGMPVRIEIPKEGAVVGIDAIAINKGTKNLAAAHRFINVALDADVNRRLAEFYKAGPMNRNAKLDPELAKLPGVFTTPEQWKTQAILIPDEVRAKLLPGWKAWFTENMAGQ